MQRNWAGSNISTCSTKFVFLGRSEIQDGHHGLWLAEAFSLLFNRGFKGKLTGSKISTFSIKFVFFGDDRRSKMAALASDWLRHFRLLLCNHWTECNETGLEARSPLPLPSLYFWGRLEIKDDRPDLWLVDTFWTSPQQPLNGMQKHLKGSSFIDGRPGFWLSETFSKSSLQPLNISTKLDRKQTLNVFYQVFICRADQKSKMAALPLIDWDIFNFSSATAERNATKLDWMQDLNVLYQVCVFSGRSEIKDGRLGLLLAETVSTSSLQPLNTIQRNWTGNKISTCSTKFVFWADRKSKMDALASDWQRHSLLLCNSGFKRKLTGSKNLTSSIKFVFWGPIGDPRWRPWPLIGWGIFCFFSATTEQNATKLEWKQDLHVLYQICIFRADQKSKMTILVSDWLIHFGLLLCNHWTECNNTWQEARSQGPLPSLCFSDRSEIKDDHNGLWLSEAFSTSSLQPLNI